MESTCMTEAQYNVDSWNAEPISREGLELSQHIRDLYTAGAKLWTKEMFRDVELELAKVPLPETVMIRSMNGELAPENVPTMETLGLTSRSLLEEDGIRSPGRVYFLQYVLDTVHSIANLREWVHRRLTASFTYFRDMVYNAERLGPNSEFLSLADRTIHTRTLTLVLSFRMEEEPPVQYPELKSCWEEAWHNWTESAACNQLSGMLTESTMPTVKNIVCFGLGNLEGKSQPGQEDIATCDGLPCFRGMTQHAAGLTMASILGRRFNTDPLPILAQDPFYTEPEKQLLEELGIKVVGDRGCLGFTFVDDHSLVYTCCPNIDVPEIIADIARPAMMLWHDIVPALAEEEKMEWTLDLVDGKEMIFAPGCNIKSASPRVSKFIEDYDEFDYNHDDRFKADMKLYIRKA